MLRAARIAIAIFCLITYGGSVAFAQTQKDDRVALSWVTPENSPCPDAAYVLAEIRRYVGPASTQAERPPISAIGTIGVNPSGFQLRLRTTEGQNGGERSFQDVSCRALADAAAVILAWMIAPEAMAERSAAADRPREAPRSTPTHPVAAAPPSAEEPAKWTLYAGAGAAADVGTMPDPALAVADHVGLAFRRLRLEVRGAYWPSRSKSLAALPSGVVPGATFSLWSVGVQACWEAFPSAARSRWGIALCLGPQLEVLSGAGFGVTAPTEATTAWMSLTSNLVGRFAVAPRVKVFGLLGGALSVQEQRFALRGVGEVYRPSALGVRSSLGLELELDL